MKIKSIICLLVLLAGGGHVMASFSTAPGYTATELYSSAGTFTTIGGLDLDGGKGELFFGQYTDIKSLDLGDNSTNVEGTVPGNTGNSLVVRHDGTTYTSYATSYISPYPYKMGYIDGSGTYVNQLDQHSIYDVAVNPVGDGYIVANPGALGSRIFKYDWANGGTTEIANIGGWSGGLAFDSGGNMYYAEQTNGEIWKFTAAEVAAGGLTSGDAEMVLSITAGYIGFDADDAFYATTGWGATFAQYDLASGTKVEDIAYGGIGKFVVDGDDMYMIDTDWVAYASTIQHVVPEPATLILLGLGTVVLRRGRL